MARRYSAFPYRGLRSSDAVQSALHALVSLHGESQSTSHRCVSRERRLRRPAAHGEHLLSQAAGVVQLVLDDGDDEKAVTTADD